MSRDGKILLVSKITRASGYGFFSILLAVYLKLLGYDAVLIGLALAASLASSAVFTVLASVLERRLGRKTTLMLFAALMVAAGITFVVSTDYAGLLLATFIGTINVSGTDSGPFQSLEQAIIPQTCAPQKRTFAFALYSMGGTLAASFGALVVNVPPILEGAGVGLLDSFRLVFVLYIVGAVVTFFLYSRLSVDAEASRPQGADERRAIMSSETKRVIAKLCALIGMDSFGGGFLLRSIVAYWFFTKFGASLGQLSLVFFGAGILTAISFLVSARIANRIGLVNTMVFTHLPSNVIVMLIPFAPTLLLATLMFQARGFLNQMDVAPRQSYIAAIVTPEERVAAAGLTNVTRNLSQAISPAATGYLLQFLSLSVPFFIGGGVKVVYDLLLYRSFKALKPPEEEREGAAPEKMKATAEDGGRSNSPASSLATRSVGSR